MVFLIAVETLDWYPCPQYWYYAIMNVLFEDTQRFEKGILVLVTHSLCSVVVSDTSRIRIPLCLPITILARLLILILLVEGCFHWPAEVTTLSAAGNTIGSNSANQIFYSSPPPTDTAVSCHAWSPAFMLLPFPPAVNETAACKVAWRPPNMFSRPSILGMVTPTYKTNQTWRFPPE